MAKRKPRGECRVTMTVRMRVKTADVTVARAAADVWIDFHRGSFELGRLSLAPEVRDLVLFVDGRARLRVEAAP